MGQLAPSVCTESASIRRLEALLDRLPGSARVSVRLHDGKQYRGLVYVRPTVQAFRDDDGVEGINGVLRLRDDDNGEQRLIWLDRIARVDRLGTISGAFES